MVALWVSPTALQDERRLATRAPTAAQLQSSPVGAVTPPSDTPPSTQLGA